MATKKRARKPVPKVVKIELRLTPELLFERMVYFGLPLPPEINTLEKFKQRITAGVKQIPALMDFDAIIKKIPPVNIEDLEPEMQAQAYQYGPEAYKNFIKATDKKRVDYKAKPTSGFKNKRPIA